MSVFDEEEDIPIDINHPDELARAIFAAFGTAIPQERYRVRQNLFEEYTLFCGTCNTSIPYAGGVALDGFIAGIRQHEIAVHGMQVEEENQ